MALADHAAPTSAAIAAAFDPRRMFDHPDPYPLFAVLRRTAAAVPIPPPGRPAWAITRHADVRAVLEDPGTWVQPSIGRVVFGQSRRARMERHTRARAVAARLFAPPAVEHLRERIEAEAHRLLDGLAGRGRFDVFTEYARPLPLAVICDLIGLPATERTWVLERAHEIIGLACDPVRGTIAAAALERFLAPLVRARRREPRDDVMSRLATSTVHGRGLSEAETLAFLRILIPAAVDPPAQMLGNVLVALLGTPALFERVCARPELAAAAVTESLRWEAPIVYVVRQPTRAVALGDATIPAGADCAVVIGSANRDEDRWTDPARFDLDRPGGDHLAFGHGRHYCLGSHLALLMGRVALTALCMRLPNLRLDPDAGAPRIEGSVFRQPAALAARVD